MSNKTKNTTITDIRATATAWSLKAQRLVGSNNSENATAIHDIQATAAAWSLEAQRLLGSNNESVSFYDIHARATAWSLEAQRLVGTNRGRDRKVRSQEDGPLCGGDFILNRDGKAGTLSFCFEKESKIYGLTVSHLMQGEDDPIGKPLFAFACSEPTQANKGEEPSYSIIEVGSVVSFSSDTDSLVFEIYDKFSHEVGLLTVAPPESGLGVPQVSLPPPQFNPTPPSVGTVVVGYGANRRGAHGVVTMSAKTALMGQQSLVDDIVIVSSTCRQESITDLGDCGAVFLDGRTGLPIYFHHATASNPPKISRYHFTKESFGVPMTRVMACHDQLGGVSSPHSNAFVQSEEALCELADGEFSEESNDLLQFKTKIVTELEVWGPAKLPRPR